MPSPQRGFSRTLNNPRPSLSFFPFEDAALQFAILPLATFATWWDVIPLTHKLQQWCCHKAGIEEILNRGGGLKAAASAELNTDAPKLIESFGNREFSGIVGFIDMRGFSALARGKHPLEVKAIAAPFISAVCTVATAHDCFIDKTLGDEVMPGELPYFEVDTILSEAKMPSRPIAFAALGLLLVDLIRTLNHRLPSVRFTSGFRLRRLDS